LGQEDRNNIFLSQIFLSFLLRSLSFLRQYLSPATQSGSPRKKIFLALIFLPQTALLRHNSEVLAGQRLTSRKWSRSRKPHVGDPLWLCSAQPLAEQQLAATRTTERTSLFAKICKHDIMTADIALEHRRGQNQGVCHDAHYPNARRLPLHRFRRLSSDR
jgi:hypothetical protein